MEHALNSSSPSGPSKAPRLRAQALWAFLVSGIGLLATIVGLAQLLLTGAIHIRPGRESLAGHDAVEQLVFLFLVSACFGALGFYRQFRANRIGGKKQLPAGGGD